MNIHFQLLSQQILLRFVLEVIFFAVLYPRKNVILTIAEQKRRQHVIVVD